jgi:hypothetical protein
LFILLLGTGLNQISNQSVSDARGAARRGARNSIAADLL